ncbi:MAG: hypothetical protein ACK53H_11445 [Betaproteobacteria bacterium]
MNDIKHISITLANTAPRHAHTEIADLLSAALLRLRARNSASNDKDNSGHRESVCLGFSPQQRVNANPDQQEGVRP